MNKNQKLVSAALAGLLSLGMIGCASAEHHEAGKGAAASATEKHSCGGEKASCKTEAGADKASCKGEKASCKGEKASCKTAAPAGEADKAGCAGH